MDDKTTREFSGTETIRPELTQANIWGRTPKKDKSFFPN